MLATDTRFAAGYLNAIEHLRGPLRSGAIDGTLTVAVDATARVDWTTREPVLVATLRGDLGNARLIVTTTVAGGAAGRLLPPAEFAAWTPRGATLPLFVPAVDSAARTAQPFACALAVQSADGDAAPAAVDPARVAGLLELHVLEGVAGRTAFLLLAEQARVRRTARVLAASSSVATARGNALDRIGAELGLPRFADRLIFDPATKTIVTQTLPAGESDAGYARRLAAFRPFLLPDANGVARTLAAGGIPGATFAETATPFPVALRVVSIGEAAARANFFQYVLQTYLVLLDHNAAADAIMHARFVSPQQRANADALRARLIAGFAPAPQAAISPFLADAFDLAFAARCALLGTATPPALALAHAFDQAAGSRYELGLGCDVANPPQAERDRLVSALSTVATPADRRLAAALGAMRAALAARAPDAAMDWFWRACGMRTVEALDAATVFVSTTAVGPLTIEGVAAVAGGPLALTAVRRSADDAGVDANLARSVAAALAAWTAAGHSAWTALSAADASTAWHASVARPVSDPIGAIIAGADLPAVTAPAFTAAQLALLPVQMLITVRLAAADASPVIGHQAVAIDALRALAGAARAAGVPSMLVLTTASQVNVVFGAYGLPGAGLNVGERGASAIRWSIVPLAGSPPSLAAQGGSCALRGDPGLALLVAVSGARTGATDPYEAGVVLDPHALLDLDGYELAMNVLARACPIGVRINTWQLRQAHVDLDGDGKADPLPPRFAAMYRWYRRRRYLGEGPPSSAGG
jgi:hypothetical protein